MQGPLPPAAVPQGGRRRGLVEEREELGLHGHVPDAQHLAAVHATLRDAAARLQRSPICL